MRVVSGDELGPPERYHLVERAAPMPGFGEVRIRLRAVGLGYADALLAAGGYQVTPPLPFTPGTEAAGTIDALGDGVDRFAVGARVIVTTFGGCLAEEMIVDVGSVHPLPDALSFEQGACFRTNYATALHALKDRGQLQRGETLLVLGAAGGVGIAAVQLGRYFGARVIAAASSEQKRAFALDHGADVAIDYREEGWRDRLKAETGGRGIDVIVDPVGGAAFEPAFRSLAWGGRHLVIGFAGGPIPRLPANLALLKGAALVGVDIRQFGIKQPEAMAANDRMIDAMCADGLHPPAGTAFAFEDFRSALAAAAAGTSLGKVVVRVA